jgi:hypothetical protein
MQDKFPRFRRGVLSIGQVRCDACDKGMQHGAVYLAVDEKPHNKPLGSVFKEETVYIETIHCNDCKHVLKDGEIYLFVLDGDSEKVFCAACYKKKGGESFRKKQLGAERTFVKKAEPSEPFHFCTACAEKRKAGVEKKEKGEKVFTFFPSKTGRESK